MYGLINLEVNLTVTDFKKEIAIVMLSLVLHL